MLCGPGLANPCAKVSREQIEPGWLRNLDLIAITLANGRHATLILTIGNLMIVPVLALLVVFVSSVIPALEQPPSPANLDRTSDQALATSAELTAAEAERIYQRFDAMKIGQQLYLDVDLTLDRLSRKLVTPARQVSAAVNQVCKRNISQVINEYRIRHAQQLLVTTNDPII